VHQLLGRVRVVAQLICHPSRRHLLVLLGGGAAPPQLALGSRDGRGATLLELQLLGDGFVHLMLVGMQLSCHGAPRAPDLGVVRYLKIIQASAAERRRVPHRHSRTHLISIQAPWAFAWEQDRVPNGQPSHHTHQEQANIQSVTHARTRTYTRSALCVCVCVGGWMCVG
jgi:hypothetical protein